MNIDLIKNRGRYIASIFIVIIILTVIGISLFRWLNSSWGESVQETYRNLDISVHRSLTYTMGSAINKNQFFYSDNGKDDERIKIGLVKAINSINTDLNGEYIVSAGFVSHDDRVYRLIDNVWKESDQNLKFDDSGELSVDNYYPDHMRIFVSTEGKERFFIVLYLDIEKYYTEIIKTDKSAIHEGYELIWHFTEPDNIEVFNIRDYQFNPIGAGRRNLVIGLSRIIQSGKDGDFKTPFRMNKYSAYIEVLKNGRPFIQDSVRSLRLQWVLYFSLLLGLGTAFALNLNQIRSLEKIRVREKEFVASITHELRTPLAVINSAADNIKSGILTKERTEQYGELIINQSKRLSDMIEGVLLFSRFEGKVERKPEYSLVRAEAVENKLMQLVEVVDKEYFKKLKIDLNLPDQFYSNLESLELILSNLILNSAKHAYYSTGREEIRVKGHYKAPGRLVFTIEDDGAGISPKEKKDIFKPFFRGEKSHENQVNGSGLGLFLTAKKVELLGGKIKLESPYNGIDGKLKQGSRFIVELEVTDA